MKIWKSINQEFIANPITNDVSLSFDKDAIRQSVRNLVLSNVGDHRFHEEIWCCLSGMLFENISSIDKQIISRDITNLLTTYEPRVVVYDVIVEVQADQRQLIVTIKYYFAKTDEVDLVNIVVKQIR